MIKGRILNIIYNERKIVNEITEPRGIQLAQGRANVALSTNSTVEMIGETAEIS